MLLDRVSGGLIDGLLYGSDGDPPPARLGIVPTTRLAWRGRVALDVRLGKLDSSTAYVEGTPRVSADGCDFATCELNSIWVHNVPRDTLET